MVQLVGDAGERRGQIVSAAQLEVSAPAFFSQQFQTGVGMRTGTAAAAGAPHGAGRSPTFATADADGNVWTRKRDGGSTNGRSRRQRHPTADSWPTSADSWPASARTARP